jgi:hypothetical protein
MRRIIHPMVTIVISHRKRRAAYSGEPGLYMTVISCFSPGVLAGIHTKQNEHVDPKACMLADEGNPPARFDGMDEKEDAVPDLNQGKAKDEYVDLVDRVFERDHPAPVFEAKAKRREGQCQQVEVTELDEMVGSEHSESPLIPGKALLKGCGRFHCPQPLLVAPVH